MSIKTDTVDTTDWRLGPKHPWEIVNSRNMVMVECTDAGHAAHVLRAVQELDASPAAPSAIPAKYREAFEAMEKALTSAKANIEAWQANPLRESPDGCMSKIRYGLTLAAEARKEQK
jgi:hypothetical protein